MTFDPRAVRHAYEAIVPEYAERFGEEITANDFDRSVLDAAVEGLDPDARIVDLGCGPGQVAGYLARSGRWVVGLDVTPAMLAIAHERHPTLRLVTGNLLTLPFRSSSLDGIVAWYSLHNLPRALLAFALAELRSALRPRGMLLVGTHGGHGEDSVEHQWMGETETVAITYYQPGELERELAAHGFEVCEVRQRPPLSHEHDATKIYVRAYRS